MKSVDNKLFNFALFWLIMSTLNPADDTNLLISNKSPKFIQNLKNLCKWSRANKISISSSKTELLIFRHPNKKIDYDDFKIKMNGKNFIPQNLSNIWEY